MIQVDISPEIEQRFAGTARAHGMKVEDYARLVLTSAAGAPPVQASPQELMNGLRSLSEAATAVTNYPSDFFTREVIYGGHD